MPWPYRVLYLAVGIYFLWGTAVYADGGSHPGTTVISGALGVLFTVCPFVPVVRVSGGTVLARGLIVVRRFPLADVVDARPGYWGLSLETDDGRTFTATGVAAKWNMSTWFGRRTAADDVAQTVLTAAAVARSQARPQG